MNEIYDELKELHLSGMAERWQTLLETRKTKEVTLDEGMEMLLQSERDKRQENRLARLVKNAHFRYEASVEKIFFDSTNGRDKDRIMQPASCDYLKAGTSVLISGPTGRWQELSCYSIRKTGVLLRLQGELLQYAEAQ